jgi:hypothetical protein
VRSTREVLNLLNAYDMSDPYSDIWGDIILGLDEYDEGATAGLQGRDGADRFYLRNGSLIRYDGQCRVWYEHSGPETDHQFYRHP